MYGSMSRPQNHWSVFLAPLDPWALMICRPSTGVSPYSGHEHGPWLGGFGFEGRGFFIFCDANTRCVIHTGCWLGGLVVLF